MELTVRPAAVSDAAALAAIYAPYVRGTAVTMELEPPDASAFAARIAATLRRYPYLAARLDGRTVGYAYAGPFHARPAYDWSVETSIYVAQDCHGRGVGRALYDALEQALGQMGVVNLCACIACPKQEPDPYLTRASMAFHARLGYALCAHFHDAACKFGRWYDVVWMEKAIAPHAPDPAPVRFPASAG